jgi:tetratricopeptide (TPR) repeat protein
MLRLYPQAIHKTVDGPSEREWSRADGSCYSFGMRKLTILLGLSASVAFAGSASAGDKQSLQVSAKAGAKADAKTDANAAKPDRKYMEQIVKGDGSYVARDFDGAIAAYREAIKLEPEKALGHYRVGAAQLAKGDQKEAEAAFVNGLRFVGKDGTLRGKLIFALADLRERQKNNDEAIARWKEYAKNAEDQKEAFTYPATATERVSRNEAWKKNVADSEEVKTRIAKRLKEADDASRKSAADPKNK